ncbi:MAG: protein BatD [Candidatus Eisenbacteria bacterium]|nr:protein BatD [Candidatus Eisenbacteria bacterium]
MSIFTERLPGGGLVSLPGGPRVRPAALAAALLAWLCLAIAAPAARAEEPRLQAAVDRNVAGVGEQITYTLTLQGGDGSPKLPPMPGFVVYAAGTSRNISIVNGKFSAAATFAYVLMPKGPGKFTLGPAEVEIGGKVVRSNSIELEVRSSPPVTNAPPQGPAGRGAPVQPPAGPGGRRVARGDDMFVRASVDRARAYVNQQVTWTFKFYNGSGRLTRTPEYSGPPVTGFWSEDLPPQRNYYEVVNGRQYYVTELRMALFPTTPGRHVIGRARLRCQVEESGRPDPDDPFSLFQMRGRVREASLTTDPLEIDALVPPKSPPEFRGAVGRYSLEASVDRQEARQNEPVTLTVRVRGQGNVKTVPDPQLPPLNNFKTYAGSSNISMSKTESQVRGEKTVQTMLLPEVVGEYTLPPLSLVYFDPDLREYRTVRTAPIPLRVRAGEAGSAVAAGGPPRAAGDVRFIRTEPGAWRAPRTDFLSRPSTWALEALPLAGWLAAALLMNLRERARRGAPARGGGRLRAAARRLGSAPPGTDAAPLLAELQRTVAEVLTESLALPAGFTRDGLDAALAARRTAAEDVAVIHAELERQDRFRYAPGALTDAARAELAAGAEALARAVDSARRKGGRR